jgi:hypothetical protein
VPIDPTLEEHAVQQVVLSLILQNDKSEIAVVREFPDVFTPPEKEQWARVVANAPMLSQLTIDDFKRRNTQRQRLADFHIDRRQVFISQTSFESIFDSQRVDDPWHAFHVAYPKASGVVTLSRVGFDPKFSQALVSYGFDCGGLCGEGFYVVLEQKGDVWVMAGSSWQYVS